MISSVFLETPELSSSFIVVFRQVLCFLNCVTVRTVLCDVNSNFFKRFHEQVSLETLAKFKTAGLLLRTFNGIIMHFEFKQGHHMQYYLVTIAPFFREKLGVVFRTSVFPQLQFWEC